MIFSVTAYVLGKNVDDNFENNSFPALVISNAPILLSVDNFFSTVMVGSFD
jgi:hypothetical protein